jgi:hypothetical protein
MRDNMTTTPLVVVLLLMAPFMMAVVAAASPAVEATNDLDGVSELEIEDAVYSDGDEISFSLSPSSLSTSSPSSPLGSSSSRSPFVEPPSSSTNNNNNNKTNTGIDANNTIISNTTSTPSSTTTTTTTAAQPTTKTNGLLTAAINGTRFTTNQTILVNGTVGEAAGSVIGLFVELKDPHNDMMAFDFAPIVRSDRPGADNETSFSYRLVAGDDGSSQDDSGGHNRRFWKPMNETGNNYTMTIGYATPAPSSSPGSTAVAAGGGEYSGSEVQFVFAYEHILPPEEEGAAAVATTTTTPAEESDDDGGDDDSSDDGEEDSSSSDDDDSSSSSSSSSSGDDDDDSSSSSSSSDDDDDSSSSSSSSSSDDDDDSSSSSSSSSDDDEIDGNTISDVVTNILDDVFDDGNNSNDQ